MADRSIFVTLGIKADTRGAKEVQSALEDVANTGDKVGDKGSKGFAALGTSISKNQRELTVLGTGMVAVGAAMTGVTMAVAKTGLEYNVLRQSSQAALSTLLGGAEQARAQMAKLDEFALTSPYARQSLIKAQQMMLAFGIEAKKVIPYLSAVNDAVAAMGGSSEDVEMVVEILAKMKAQGRVTAQELRQLGLHGVDAATLIGNSMGKTADQIRDMIRKGTLDGDTALDALVEGMQTRFGGAAAAVKDGFVGALDRVKAAFRDFSSSAMTPFVDPDGGGMFVGLLNGVADFIRVLDKLPAATKTGGLVITALGGAASLAAGSFMLLAPRIVDTIDAMDRLKGSSGALGSVARGLGAVGKAAGAVGVVLAALKVGDLIMTAFRASAPEIEKTTAALLSMRGGLQGVDQLFADIGRETMVASTGMSNVNDMGSAMEALINPSFMARMNDFAGSVLSFGGRAGRAERDALVKQFDQMGESLAEMVLSGNGERAAEIYRELKAQWVAAGGSVEDLNALMPAYGAALETLANDAELAADGQSGLSEASLEAAAAAEQAADAYSNYLDALRSLADYQDGLVNSFLAGRDAQREWDEATAAFNDTAEMSEAILDEYADTARKSIMTMLEARDANGERIYSEDELIGKMQQSRDAVIAAAMALGYEAGEAEALADSMGLIPEEVPSRIAVDDLEAQQAVAEMQAALGELPPDVITQILTMGGPEAVEMAGLVNEAIEAGVPPEKIVDILTNEDVTMQAPLIIAAISRIPTSKTVPIDVNDNASGPVAEIQRRIDSLTGKTVTVYVQTVQSGIHEFSPGYGGGTQIKATGGPVFGPGTGTSDSIPVWMSNNEHVITAAEVASFGGHGNVQALRALMRARPQDLRKALGFAQGGSPGYTQAPILIPTPAAGGDAPQLTVFVENPWTGEQVEARVASVADGRIGEFARAGGSR